MSSSVTYSSNSSRSKASVTSLATVDDSTFTMVVAIDIGTSHSGYAYCYRREVEDSLDNIYLNAKWAGHEKSVSTFKCPTYLLLNEKREFEAFGYDAERKYAELQHQGRHQRCFFFRRFKTKLFGNQSLKASHALKDELGKSISAIKVFSNAIRYLKGHLLNALRMRGRDVSTEDIKWVITTPAIWSDVSKQFMRQAAVQAGIPPERLKLALEAEVASIYCQNLPHVKGTSKLPITAPGATYVVADIGGGTTDIVFHQKRSDGRLREISKGGGCLVGSGHVDNAFLQFLVRLLGAPTVRDFLDEYKLEYLQLLRDFDQAKHGMTANQRAPIIVKIPVGLERHCRQKQNGESISNIVMKSVYREKVRVVDEKFYIDAALSLEFFRAACIEIARNIKKVLLESSTRTNYLILVGGMAESTILQEIVKQELEGKTQIQRIIVPPEPEVVVLKGAVMFGHNPAVHISAGNAIYLRTSESKVI